MSLINKDFRFREPEYDDHRHSKLRWSLFFIACATIGVVIANTTDTPEVDIVSTQFTSHKIPLNTPPERQTIALSVAGKSTALEVKQPATAAVTANSKTPDIKPERNTKPNPPVSQSSATTISKHTTSNKLISKIPATPVPKSSSATTTVDSRDTASAHIPPATLQALTIPALADNTSPAGSNQQTATAIEQNKADTNKAKTNHNSAIIAGNTDNKISTTSDTLARSSFTLGLPALQAHQKQLDESNHLPVRKWREFKVKKGDSLAKLFSRAGIKARQLDELMKSGKDVKTLRKIFPGDVIRILTDDSGLLQALQYDINHKSYLMVERKQDKLVADIFNYQIDTLSAHASGTIESSLFLAAQKAGISQNIIMELAGIFGWDIDFALDIRKGDTFTVIYEEQYRDGEKISDGDILAAEFVNQGKVYRAVRYTNPETKVSEYYTPEGKSMRKAFLRTPVNFSRISSRFTINRYHPVLHKFRSHKGVDYAAKRGTPIRAAGDGKVIFKGKKGGYGRVVIIQHGTRYTTLYAHLNSYNKKIRKGSKVKQGQTIAYVGSSGLATGPHLHYEFRVNGVHRNPLTVKLPESAPVPKRYLADFQLSTSGIIAQLDSVARSQQIALVDSKQ